MRRVHRDYMRLLASTIKNVSRPLRCTSIKVMSSANGQAGKPTPAEQKPKKSNRPSPEEIEEKRKQRAEKKQREEEEKKKLEDLGVVGVGKDGKSVFRTRQWSNVRDVDRTAFAGRHRVRILSWNILAQGLVRRKLFPGSDCLKWKDREVGVLSEMVSHNWDLAAFQEVDRIEAHTANLEKHKRKFVYAKGYNDKQHGLLIAWRTETNDEGPEARAAFEEKPAATKVIFFDREHVDARPGHAGSRTALSRVTRNIALLVALKFKNGSNASKQNAPKGLIMATTHLFWHPMHAYERLRQTAILKRGLTRWRDEHEEWADWPIVVAGDFNDQPHSANYKLVIGEKLTSHCLEEVRQSTVVHQSVDELRKKVEEDQSCATEEEAVVENGAAAQADGIGPGRTDEKLDEECENEDEEEGEGEDDQMLKNCRAPKKDDGLLSFEEFLQLHDLSQAPPGSEPLGESKKDGELLQSQTQAGLISSYGSHHHNLEVDQKGNFFGSDHRWRERHDDPDWNPDAPNPHLNSSHEPMYTLFSSLFALTLDYILLFPDHRRKQDEQQQVVVSALLPTHSTEVLKPGIPRLGVCASDHVAIGAELLI